MRGVRDALFEIDDFYARQLHYDDKADLQAFCECHADYFELATGSRPSPRSSFGPCSAARRRTSPGRT